MSKKITHEQAREGLLQVYIYNDIHTNEANYVLVRDYITQQEKQEKLLELYKALIEDMKIIANEWNVFFPYGLDGLGLGEVYLTYHQANILKQIKEIEDDR